MLTRQAVQDGIRDGRFSQATGDEIIELIDQVESASEGRVVVLVPEVISEALMPFISVLKPEHNEAVKAVIDAIFGETL